MCVVLFSQKSCLKCFVQHQLTHASKLVLLCQSNQGAEPAQDGRVAEEAVKQAPVGHARRSQRSIHLSTKLKVSMFFAAVTIPSVQDARWMNLSSLLSLLLINVAIMYV